MAHLLFADTNATSRRVLRQALEPDRHVADETTDPSEIAGLVEHAIATHDPYDLLLIGTFPGGPEVGALLKELGAAVCDHAIVLLGTFTGKEETQRGVMGTVDPTLPEGAMRQALGQALARRERYVNRLGEWKLALSYLDAMSSAGLESPQRGLAAQRSTIADHLARLPDAIAAAAPDEAAVHAAFAAVEVEVNQVLNQLPGNLDDMLELLTAYASTPTFWVTLRHTFAHDRVRCYALLAELRRLHKDGLAHGRIVAPGHFELSVGSAHRVFFRLVNGQRVIEDFVPAARRDAVITRLAGASEDPVALATQSLPV